MKNKPGLLCLLAASLLWCWPTSGKAQTIISQGHVDIFAVGWEPGNSPPPSPGLPDPRWFVHAHDEENGVEYLPASVLFFVKPQALVGRPAGSQWNFIGTGAGQNVWVLPQTQNVNLIYGGVAAEEIEPGTFLTYSITDPRINNGNPASAEWVHYRLRGVNGPGQFSMWQTDTFGQPVVWMASADGIQPSDFVVLPAGSHVHYNWGFTEPGFYEVIVEATAFLPNGDPTISGEVSYFFAVNAVPEPGSLALMGLVCTGAGAWYYRQRRARRLMQ